MLQYSPYVRIPFAVQAILITPENIEELASVLGKLEVDENGEQFIRLDRRVVPNIKRARIGSWVTFVNDNYRCYTPKAFEDQFAPMEPTMVFSFGDDENTVDDTLSNVGDIVLTVPENLAGTIMLETDVD